MSDNSHDNLLQGKQSEQLVKSSFFVNTGATATSLGTITIPAPATVDYMDIRFKLATLGIETVALTGSVDGTNYETISLRPFKNADGLVFGADALIDGEYVIPASWPYQKYKFTKSSTSAVAVLGFCATYVPKN